MILAITRGKRSSGKTNIFHVGHRNGRRIFLKCGFVSKIWRQDIRQMAINMGILYIIVTDSGKLYAIGLSETILPKWQIKQKADRRQETAD